MSASLERLRTLRLAMMREWKFVLGTFAASGVGYLGSSAAPVIVAALLEAGLSHKQAGDLGTIELTTVAVSTMLMTPFVAHYSHRRMAVIGAVIAALGLLVSALSIEYSAMMIGRLLIGVGSGIAISGANGAIAAREDAERIFAIIWTMGGGITAMLTIELPPLVAGGNYAVAFWVLLLLCTVGIFMTFWIPHRPAALAKDSASIEDGSEHLSRFAKGSALLILTAVFIYSLAEQALWQFSLELALDRGIGSAEASHVLGATVLMGLVGGAVAATLGLRFGRVFPIVIGTLFSVAGRWIYISAGTVELLWVGGLLWGLGFYFVTPYQFGLAAALDRRGRVVVAAAGLSNLGYGVGPSIAGRIRQYQVDNGLDHSMLIWLIAGGTFVSLLLLLPVAIHQQREARAAAAKSARTL